jgi:hypothetical protein
VFLSWRVTHVLEERGNVGLRVPCDTPSYPRRMESSVAPLPKRQNTSTSLFSPIGYLLHAPPLSRFEHRNSVWRRV